MGQAIALINTILGLIDRLGPIALRVVNDFGPVAAVVNKIIKGEEITAGDLAQLQAIADALHAGIQSSPETPA